MMIYFLRIDLLFNVIKIEILLCRRSRAKSTYGNTLRVSELLQGDALAGMLTVHVRFVHKSTFNAAELEHFCYRSRHSFAKQPILSQHKGWLGLFLLKRVTLGYSNALE